MATKQQIIDRIEKLYALASGGTSIGEAAAATAMAEKLMRKHSIGINEVNKHRYTKGEKAKTSYRPREETRHYNAYEEYRKQRQQRKQSWHNEYYQKTFEPFVIKADKLRETDKAVLLNVHLDAAKYPWSRFPVITVSTWLPKSQVASNIGSIWLVNEWLLRKNLTDNIPWLTSNHPVFKGQNTVEFHFKGII